MTVAHRRLTLSLPLSFSPSLKMVPTIPHNPLVFSTLRAGITTPHSGTIDEGTKHRKLAKALLQELKMALKTLHTVLINLAFDRTVVSMLLRVKKIKNKSHRK